jgi:phosphoribosylformylglycinamidine synthase
VPAVDAQAAKRTFAAVHQAIAAGLVRACHDLSEGGLAVAAAEMAFAGGLGARISLHSVPRELPTGLAQVDLVLLFAESNTRFLCEVAPPNAAAFETAMRAVTTARIGEVTAADRLEILGTATNTKLIDAPIAELKEAWQKPLRW